MTHQDTKDSRISKWEYLMPLMIILSLVLSCILVSPKKPFWNDELFSFYFLSDPSFQHMMQAFGDKLNNTPFVYFGIGWFWDKIFGSSELSLRLFSSLGMGIASFFVWLTLRETYGFLISSVATTATFCTSSMILNQNSEARMYGLYMALGAVALYLYSKINLNLKLSNYHYYGNIMIHAALVNTHLHGLFYSAGVLAAFFLRDRFLGLFRSRVYISILISWLTLAFYIPAFLVQADAGNPRSWLPTPGIRDLYDFIFLQSWGGWLMRTNVIIAILFLGAWLSIFNKPAAKASPRSLEEDLTVNKQSWSLLIFGLVFLMIPVFIWFISRAIRPIFFDRYMILSILGWSVLLAFVCSRLFNTCEWSVDSQSKTYSWIKLVRVVPISLFIIFMLAKPVVFGLDPPPNLKTGLFGIDDNDNRMGFRQLPIAINDSDTFMERNYHSAHPERYYFILDKAAAMDPTSGQFGVQSYKHMDAWKRVYPNRFSRQVLTSDEFLAKFNKFLVIDFPDYNKKCPVRAYGTTALDWRNIQCPQWLEKRILSNPSYRVKKLSVSSETRLLVTKTR
jgi:hypothetical protein